MEKNYGGNEIMNKQWIRFVDKCTQWRWDSVMEYFYMTDGWDNKRIIAKPEDLTGWREAFWDNQHMESSTGWVSVEDKMPPPDTESWIVVLINDNGIPYPETDRAYTGCKTGQIKFAHNPSHLITHWMSLPKFPNINDC